MRDAMMRLGARGTIILVLLILVAGVVGVARLVGGSLPRREPALDAGSATAASTVDPSVGDDGVVATTRPPKDDPAVRAAATTFMKAWLRSDLTAARWHDGIAALATKDLADRLDGVDPSGVPASRTTGAAEIVTNQADFAQVDVPVDSGTVTLRLRRTDGSWLVDAVDWTRT